MKILVTGGAGFIGSHLIDALLTDHHEVVCIDDLSLGTLDNLRHLSSNSHFRFEKLDLNQEEKLMAIFLLENFEVVFHMAANSDIQSGAKSPIIDLNKTFLTTFHVLECMRKAQVKKLVFASTSAIYGELKTPLHESIGPLFPISLYGAAKLSSEAFLSAYGENFGIQNWIFRFPNVIGFRSTHGAMFDFMNRLKKNPLELAILGDGTQSKPYLYVEDLVEGILFGWKKAKERLNCFNLGVSSTTKVSEIAEIVVGELGLSGVKFQYSGGDRGWVGDVPQFEYDLSKINALGWTAKHTSNEAVRLAVKAEIANRRKQP
jgi:UDP-glucose 4-epimerase